MNDPIVFDVVLPPSDFEYEDLVKRELVLAIYAEGVLQMREVIDVPKNLSLLQGFEGDASNEVHTALTDIGLEDRQEVDPRTGRMKPGQVEVRVEAGKGVYTLSAEMWCPAGVMGIRTSVEPPSVVQSFQDEEAMRILE